jgi:GNAT superfamily N-acetyltransferase
MAGERLQSAAFAEMSAVGTHPEFRGRGYARALVTFLAAQILAAGKTNLGGAGGASGFSGPLDSDFQFPPKRGPR